MHKTTVLFLSIVLLFACFVTATPNISTQQTEQNSSSKDTNSQTIQRDTLTSDDVHSQHEVEKMDDSKDGVPSCADLIPNRARANNIGPQQSESPFTIQVSPDTIQPGDEAKITIATQGQGHTLRAFALQVSELSSSWRLGHSKKGGLGQFLQAENTNLQTCHTTGDTIVYFGPEVEDHVTLVWRSSPEVEGSITIRGTLIENDNTYWIDVFSNRLKIYFTDPDTSDISVESPEVRTAVSDALEDANGPVEDVEEVLVHQGIRSMQRIDTNGDVATDKDGEAIGIQMVPVELDNEISATDDDIAKVKPETDLLYSEMNDYPQDFEPPQTAEFLGTLMKVAGGASAVSKLMGGGSKEEAEEVCSVHC